MKDDFEAKVRQQVDRLKKSPFQTIERQVAEKRIKWFQQHYPSGYPHNPSPRRAFELLFFDYMGLNKDDLPIISESDTEIEWLSLNSCPTLEACIANGQDTRQVCRAAYEKSTQALVSQLDPQLRFLRSYEEIRPYAAQCREKIVHVDFQKMMSFAVKEAKKSLEEGNKGYGAVIVIGNQIAAASHDTTATRKDPSLHAEVNAIRLAVKNLGDTNLSGAILFSTCEPCPMCSSLAVWANITSIVYGISIQETAKLGKSRIDISAKEIIEKSPVMIEIIGDVLKDKCKDLYL